MKKYMPFVFILFLAALLLLVGQQAQASGLTGFSMHLQKDGIAVIDPDLQSSLATLQPGEMVTVIVTLKDQYQPEPGAFQNMPDKAQRVIEALQSYAQASQQGFSAALVTAQSQGRVSGVTPFWIFNGFSITATADMIREIASRGDVASITPDSIDIIPVGTINQSPPASNLSSINIPALWDLGDYGQGIVVANMDTGVDLYHPELSSRWRGGSNSWFDPYNQHATPTDLNGHGTWTMGVMVAGDGSGTAIGAAPSAQWIAVKIFNDSGTATATAIHLGYQWLLDPDGNPSTSDAPQVINNSWAFGTPGCNLEFQNDLVSLRLAGILPVFSAGNYGPGSSTSVSPANYPEAFAVGSVDNAGAIQTYSGRGPSACGETTSIYPEVVAPGAAINTTDLYGLYTQASGTSLSAPHVSGLLALLINAFPGLSAESQEAALLNTGTDLGSGGPDNDYGYGMVDALAAYQWLAAGNRATPTPAPTATATPLPTPTPAPTSTPTPVVDMVFADSFETGVLAQWSSAVTDGGRLSVTGQAAMEGTYGMQAVINSNSPIYVLDDSPVAEASYHARFYFSPNSVTLPRNKTQDLFSGRTSTGEAVFRLQLQSVSGNYRLRGAILTGNGKTLSTSWYAINNGVNSIELAWQAASTSKGSDGYLSLWLDGTLKETRSNVANGVYRLEEALLGPQTIPSGTSGTEYFDAFYSTHTTYIGP